MRAMMIWAVGAVLMLVPVQGAGAGSNGDLSAQDGHVLVGVAPPGVDAISATQVFNGTRNWFFVIDDSDVAVTNPTITVDGGYPVSAFPGGLGGATTFPVSVSQSLLNPGESFFSNPLAQFGVTTIPVTMSPGFDSTSTATPLIIPAGGGHQRLTVTITPRTTLPQYTVAIYGPDGLVATQVSGPSDMNSFEAGVTYTLVYDLSVPNPFGVPFTFEPNVHINGGSNSISCCIGPTASISVPDSTLDGGDSGRGLVSYSVDQTVGQWSINNGSFLEVVYPGLVQPLPTSTDQCNRGGWQTFGVFKNQGDCVSYVATGGKNPPSGG